MKRTRLTILGVLATAFLLVPAGQALAQSQPKVNLAGTGKGEVSSVGSYEGGEYSGTPPIECSNIPGGEKSVCQNVSSQNLIALHAIAGPGSEFTEWVVEVGNAFVGCEEEAGTGEAPGCQALGSGSFGSGPIEVTAVFSAIPYPLNVFLGGNGEGTVTSSPAGINCGVDCEQEYNAGTTVTLTAAAQAGSVFAGWLGCKHETATTCKVVISEAREVTAVFLTEGVEGPQGEIGPAGPAGSDGAQGPAGKDGAVGAQGPPGPEGKQGPRGPAGKVTCKVKGNKKIKCTVKTTASSSRAHFRWSLHRAGHTVSHGNTTAAGLQRILNHLRHGRYVLRLDGQKGMPIAIA